MSEPYPRITMTLGCRACGASLTYSMAFQQWRHPGREEVECMLHHVGELGWGRLGGYRYCPECAAERQDAAEPTPGPPP